MEIFTERNLLKDILPEKAKDIAKQYKLKVNEIEFIRKKNPLKAEDIKIEDGERAAIRYINTADLDRDNEIVLPSGGQVNDFKKSPSVLYGHNYQGLPIGKDIWIKHVQGKGWLAKTVYAKHQLAVDVYNLVKEKFLNTSSIGFIPLESVKPDDKSWGKWKEVVKSEYSISEKLINNAKRIYTKWIMLEHSDVPIPSNINALNIAVGKGFEIKSQELIDDLELVIIDDEEDKNVNEIITEIEDEVETIDSEEKVCPECGADVEIDAGYDYLECTKCDWNDANIGSKEAITKPEETTDYIHIPAKGEEGKHSGHKIRTMDIDVKQGIKGKYCIDCKKIISFMFDKAKGWTMAKAKKWMADHGKNIKIEDYIKKGIMQFKERWNKSLSGNFDVERDKEPPTTFEYNMFKEFLNCEVRNIFKNTYSIPSPLLGTYLAGFKMILNEFELEETRNFSYSGIELPPVYEVIRLNSTESDDFLIEGVQFYTADNKPLIIKITPNWYGINVSVITSNKHRDWNKKLLKEAHEWAKDNNYLKGEKFALSGEFLEKSEDDWESLITELDIKDAVKKSVYSLENKMKDLDSRGLLFVGVPGTGKTKTGRILLNNVDSTFIWVSSRDFMRGYNVLSLAFSLARDLAPTVLFIEDIDIWLGGSIVDLLKTELDGLRQNKGILTILTSNSPEKLPDALLDRPGRFHHVLRFPLPNAEFRKEMIINWAGDINEKILDKIVEKTEHFSGAHIKELVDFAKIIADEEKIEIGEALLKSLNRLIAQRELIAEIRENKKSLKELKNIFQREKDKYFQKAKEEPSKSFSPNEVYEIVKENIELINKLEDVAVELKAGAVLNKKNKDNLRKIKALADEVLESAETAEPAEEGKEVDELEIEEQILDIDTKEEEEPDEPVVEEKETIDIDEKELVKIIRSALEEKVNKSVEGISKNIKQDIDDNFKRITGKVI